MTPSQRRPRKHRGLSPSPSNTPAASAPQPAWSSTADYEPSEPPVKKRKIDPKTELWIFDPESRSTAPVNHVYVPETTPTPQDKVFETTELLENILVHLRPNHLLRSQAVCKGWRNCYQNSRALKLKTFEMVTSTFEGTITGWTAPRTTAAAPGAAPAPAATPNQAAAGVPLANAPPANIILANALHGLAHAVHAPPVHTPPTNANGGAVGAASAADPASQAPANSPTGTPMTHLSFFQCPRANHHRGHYSNRCQRPGELSSNTTKVHGFCLNMLLFSAGQHTRGHPQNVIATMKGVRGVANATLYHKSGQPTTFDIEFEDHHRTNDWKYQHTGSWTRLHMTDEDFEKELVVLLKDRRDFTNAVVCKTITAKVRLPPGPVGVAVKWAQQINNMLIDRAFQLRNGSSNVLPLNLQMGLIECTVTTRVTRKPMT